MTALAILKLWMIATAVFVAPFHRFAAVYVGCYAAGVAVRHYVGISEAEVNLLWHSAALAFALHFPVMRTSACLAVLSLFAPLLLVDGLRLAGALEPYSAWWATFWIVAAQLTLLPFGADWARIRARYRAWREGSGNQFLRLGAA